MRELKCLIFKSLKCLIKCLNLNVLFGCLFIFYVQHEFSPCGRKINGETVRGRNFVDSLYVTDYFYVLSEFHPTEAIGKS